MTRIGVVAASAAAALLLAGCSGGDDVEPKARAAAKPACIDRAGWQRLANRVRVPVYCPGWMPNPLNAKLSGEWFNGTSVDRRTRAFLVSFLWHESQSGDVHVNLRGYPGRTRIPTCLDTRIVGGSRRAVRVELPCFADARGHRRANGIAATVYTVNQDADQWHVLYAWRRDGTLYALSEHVTPPLTYAKVVRNLDRMLRSLVLIKPVA